MVQQKETLIFFLKGKIKKNIRFAISEQDFTATTDRISFRNQFCPFCGLENREHFLIFLGS